MGAFPGAMIAQVLALMAKVGLVPTAACALVAMFAMLWAHGEQKKTEEKIARIKELQATFHKLGEAAGKTAKSMTQLGKAVKKIGEVFAVGDLVELSSDEDIVRSSVRSGGYNWDDQIYGMLGKTLRVLAVGGGRCEDGMVALPSPDGRQFFFSTTVLRMSEASNDGASKLLERKRQHEERGKQLLQQLTDQLKKAEGMLGKPNLTEKDRDTLQGAVAQIKGNITKMTPKQEQAPPRAPESEAEAARSKSD